MLLSSGGHNRAGIGAVLSSTDAPDTARRRGIIYSVNI